MLSIAMMVQWSTCGSNGPLSFTHRRPARPEHGSVRCLAGAHPIIPAPTTITSALPDLSASPAGGQRGRCTGPSDAWRRRPPSSPRPPPSRGSTCSYSPSSQSLTVVSGGPTWPNIFRLLTIETIEQSPNNLKTLGR